MNDREQFLSLAEKEQFLCMVDIEHFLSIGDREKIHFNESTEKEEGKSGKRFISLGLKNSV